MAENKKKFEKWIVLTSRSGQTFEAVSSKIQRKPDLIYRSKDFSHKSVMGRLRVITPQLRSNIIITLMGYMRIVDKDICNNFNVVNLHPAPIQLGSFNEYKGKDPIERYFKDREASENVEYIWGSVIHKVTPELDEGPILKSGSYLCRDIEECYNMNFNLNVKLWNDYLKEHLA